MAFFSQRNFLEEGTFLVLEELYIKTGTEVENIRQGSSNHKRKEVADFISGSRQTSCVPESGMRSETN